MSPDEARKALWHVHGLDRLRGWKGKSGVLAMFSRHPVVQSDPIDVAGRNHDLTVQARVAGYRPAHLEELLYGDRALFEYYCKMASVLPVGSYPLFARDRALLERRMAPRFRRHTRAAKEVMVALEAGPVSSRDFEGEKLDHWWGPAKVHRIVLEMLFMAGSIVVHHREAGTKVYSLPERVISARLLKADRFTEAEAAEGVALMVARSARLVPAGGPTWQWFNVVRGAGASGKALARLSEDGSLLAVEVDGMRGRFLIPSEDEGAWRDPPETDGGVRFVAPLDPLLWHKPLFTRIQGNEYVWEVYKRPRERKYGYYCLPVLWNGDYVGLIEPFFMKKDGLLETRSLHVFKGVDGRKLKAPLEEALADFARYVGASGAPRLPSRPHP